MELFHKYYNSDVQFLLEMFAFNRPFSQKELLEMAERCHVYAPYGNLWKGIEKHTDAKIIEKCSDEVQYQINPRLNSFAAPLNKIENDCLQALSRTEEAKLLISDELREKIPSQENSYYNYIRTHSAAGKSIELQKQSPETVRNVLRAIREGRWITYQFCTNRSEERKTGSCIPFRIEVSGFDGRWWLISYLPEENRPIKSRLENMSEVKLGKIHNLSEEVIRQGIEKKLMSEKVVLRISSSDKLHNSLERCFITFESMLDIEAYKLSESEYEIRFRCFEWDEKLVVRKLLWLGKDVTAIAPSIIVEGVKEELRETLETLR